jgi:hypothetical protein
MIKEPNDAQLMQLYRDWWQASYGTQPNSQATIVAAAFARHALATFTALAKINDSN